MSSVCDNDFTHTTAFSADENGARRGGEEHQWSNQYLSSMVLGLIEDSYLSAETFTDFAAEVLEVVAYAVTVPVAFTEGFLRSYLSVERITADDDGRITIIPRKAADLEDVIGDADAILARVDEHAVYDPVVQARLTGTHQISRAAMRWDLDELTAMDDEQLMEVLRVMQADSERDRLATQERREATTDYLRARIQTVRRNVQAFASRESATGSMAEQDA